MTIFIFLNGLSDAGFTFKVHIKGLHFDEISDVLKDTLLADGVSKADVEIVMTHIDQVRELIVCE